MSLPWVTWDKSRPGSERKLVHQFKLADDPSWTVIGVDVMLPPNGSTPPHRHGGASVIGHVLEGEITSAMNDEEPKTYKPGESWYEAPGCLHRIADNANVDRPARLFATFVIKTEVIEREGMSVLVQIEPEYLKQMQEK